MSERLNPKYKPHIRILTMIRQHLPDDFKPTFEILKESGLDNSLGTYEYRTGVLALNHLADVEHRLVRKNIGTQSFWCKREKTVQPSDDAKKRNHLKCNSDTKGTLLLTIPTELKTLLIDVAKVEGKGESDIIEELIASNKIALESRTISSKVRLTMERFNASREDAEAYLKDLEESQ